MTRGVEDNALLLQAMTGAAYDGELRAGVRGLRIGVVEHFRPDDDDVDAPIALAFADAVRLLRSLGAAAQPVQLPALREWSECGRILQQYEQYLVHREWLESRPQDYCGLSRAKLSAGAALSPQDYEDALARRKALCAALDAVLRQVDALVCLSGFHVPARIDDAAEVARTYVRHARMPFNVSGTPAIAVPTGFSEQGLPLGMQIASRAFGEPLLYRIAWAYCEAAGTTSWSAGRRPAFAA
jgi:aspartyl-tRNA(Asn)/glutamyl-tRNA(Gln) amidotransferase subunit A